MGLDFISAIVVVLSTGMLALGVKESAWFISGVGVGWGGGGVFQVSDGRCGRARSAFFDGVVSPWLPCTPRCLSLCAVLLCDSLTCRPASFSLRPSEQAPLPSSSLWSW
jgi:hypothetical protein